MLDCINIGLGSFVSSQRVMAIVSPDSAPIKRMVQEAKDKGLAIDSTYGRRTRAVIVLDNGQVVLSPIQPSTIIERNSSKTKSQSRKEDKE